MPLVLVAALITLNVIMADEVTGPDLENTIAIALTAVFVLPKLVAGEDDLIHVGWSVLWKTGPVYLLFIGMILAAICHNPSEVSSAVAADDIIVDIGGSSNLLGDLLGFGSGEADVAGSASAGAGWQQFISWAGAGIVWLSTLPLFANVWRYNNLKKRIVSTSMAPVTSDGKKSKRLAFVKDETFFSWEPFSQTSSSKDGRTGLAEGDIKKLDIANLQRMQSCHAYNDRDLKAPWTTSKSRASKGQLLLSCGPKHD